MVEGSKNGIQDIIGAKLEEHLKYIVLDGHSYMATLWWFSEPVWQQLPDDIKTLIVQAFAEQKSAASELVYREEANSYRIFEEAGGTVYRLSDEEKQAFKNASRNMRQWFIDNYGHEWLNVLESSADACLASS